MVAIVASGISKGSDAHRFLLLLVSYAATDVPGQLVLEGYSIRADVRKRPA